MDGGRGALGGTWRALSLDAAENLDAHPRLLVTLKGLALSRGVQVAALHRLAHAASDRGLTLPAEVLMRISALVFGADVHYRARIGPGIVFRHPTGVVIGRDVVIGERVRVFQNVTLGKRIAGSGPDGMPVVEDDVHLFAGAVVLGPITVGAGSQVGANVVLAKSCPPRSIVVSPAPEIRPA